MGNIGTKIEKQYIVKSLTEEMDTVSISGVYRDRRNIDRMGARPKEKSYIGCNTGGNKDRQNMDDQGTKRKENYDTGLDSGGFRDNEHMNYTGDRPKYKSDTGCDKGGNRDIQNNHGARRKEKTEGMRDTVDYIEKQSMDSKLQFRSGISYSL